MKISRTDWVNPIQPKPYKQNMRNEQERFIPGTPKNPDTPKNQLQGYSQVQSIPSSKITRITQLMEIGNYKIDSRAIAEKIYNSWFTDK